MKIINKLAAILLAIFVSLPVQVFAHGPEEEQEGSANLLATYGLPITALLLVVSIGLFFLTKKKITRLNVKKQQDRLVRDKLSKLSKVYAWISAILFALVLVTGYFTMADSNNNQAITMKHIHGLGYTNDGDEIYVPAHTGLGVYQDGVWRIPEGPKHDYMGFSMVDDGFYSSGHPEQGSDMKNPFGVIKSKDGGKTLETLDLYGEVDFHGMTVGYQSHAIYVFNPHENSKMKEPGLYYSTDETKTWNQSKLQGLQGQAYALAAHPTKENVVALGTAAGLYVSNDHGNTFSEVLSDVQVTAVSYDLKGNLLVGGLDPNTFLMKVNSETKETKEITLPELAEEMITYIAVNPQNKDEFTFATDKKNIFQTKNLGDSWKMIAENGQGINTKHH
jgi:preprotein translocase subunit SecG